jgi:hypothetical protein
MGLADSVILVGNHTTLGTFPDRWHPKIRLVNYAPPPTVWPRCSSPGHRGEFVYAASTRGLRKGFLDVIDTWRSIPAGAARLNIVGRLDEPYRTRLATSGAQAVLVHGWIPSRDGRYAELLRSCRYAYIPTWVEGQMGTLLETIAAGCIPLLPGQVA